MHHLVYFFCFRHHHTYTIFSLRYYVVVILALRVPSNSVSSLHGFAPCLHTSFPICLLKSSCNSYSTSTCLMTNTLRVLESRVFLHYLIKIFFFCSLAYLKVFTVPPFIPLSAIIIPEVKADCNLSLLISENIESSC